MLNNFALNWLQIIRANHKKGCIFLTQIGCKLTPKREFFGEFDQDCFGLAVVSHHGMPFKDSRRRLDHKDKVA